MQKQIVAQSEVDLKDPPFESRNHLFALYHDSQGFRACVRWFGETDSFSLSEATGRSISGAIILDDTAESVEGYDDDPTAEIIWLHPNQYIALMSPAEVEQVRTFQWEATPRREASRRNPLTGHFLGGGRGQ